MKFPKADDLKTLSEAEKPSFLAQMRSIENPAEQMALFRKNKEAILRGK